VAELDSFPVPRSQAPPLLRDALRAIVRIENLKDDPLDRVVHAYRKGLRDLVRLRCGDVGRLPDVVVRPGSEEEAAGIVRVALAADAS
jgi:alkyldihydroxyacetonephosphate synthase